MACPDVCCVTFSQAPSLSGGSLLSSVKFEGSSRCSSSLPKPQMCVGPLNRSRFTPTCSTYEDSPNPKENWSQENGLLRTLVKVKITVDEIIIVLMLNVLMWVIVLWLCRRISLFLRNTKINTWQLREIISIYFQMI